MRWFGRHVVTLLVCGAVCAATTAAADGGIVALRPVLIDDGDCDGRADTGETIEMRLVVRNASGIDLSGVRATAVARDPSLACVSQDEIEIGALLAGETRTTASGFVFTVGDHVRRVTLEQLLVATFLLRFESDEVPQAGYLQRVDLHLDLDVAGGVGPGEFREEFEATSGFGAFVESNLDAEIQAEGFQTTQQAICPYSVPDVCATCEACVVGTSPEHAEAFHWSIDAERSFEGLQSLYMGIPLVPALGSTTPMDALEAVRTAAPIHVDHGSVCSAETSIRCGDDLECPAGQSCIDVVPELTFKHQISLVDSRTFAIGDGRSLDRAIVQVRRVNVGGTPIEPWRTVHPWFNVYDKQPASQYVNCTFDPVDDGDATADPTSSTCFPEFAFAALGDTDDPFDTLDVADASDGPGLAGAVGTGTWVESRFDLSVYRGSSIELRFLTSHFGNVPDHPLIGPQPDWISWEDAYALNPVPGDDGWWIDDVRLSFTLDAPASRTVDAADALVPPADGDGDRVLDGCDRCPAVADFYQVDTDGDGLGDACDPCPTETQNDDLDGDGVCDPIDSCPATPDPLDLDGDGDGVGDVCDSCPSDANSGQEDADEDGIGDACDACPDGPGTDLDDDGVPCGGDVCPAIADPAQTDGDGDGRGDACDPCPADPFDDPDGDGACEDVDTCPGLWNPDQGPALLLTPLDLATAAGVGEFALTGDGGSVVFVSDLEGASNHLYALDLPSRQTRRLSGDLLSGGRVRYATTLSPSFFLSPGGSEILYRADPEIDDTVEAFVGTVAGGPPRRVNGAVDEGTDVRPVEWTPDGAAVVFIAEAVADGKRLFRASVGGALPVPLSPWGVRPRTFAVAPDGSAVLYIAPVMGEGELYRVPIGGGEPIRLGHTLDEGEAVLDTVVSPDGSTVLYRVREAAGVRALYAVPISGGSSIRLDADTANVSDYWIAPDGARVVYETRQLAEGMLYSVPILGGAAVRLDAALPPGRELRAGGWTTISPDSSWVVFSTESDPGGSYALYLTAIGGGPLLELTTAPWLPQYAIAPDGSRVIVRQGVSTEVELFSLPFFGGTLERLNDPLPAGHVVSDFVVSADSQWVLYTADPNVSGTRELFRVPIAGGSVERISGDVAGTGVGEYAPAPALNAVLFTARTASDGPLGLFLTDLDPDPDGDGIIERCDVCPGVADTWPADADFDGFGAACGDCDDGDAATAPGAAESNDSIDNQCPGDAGYGLIDELGPTLRFADPADPTRLSWAPQPGATTYDVVRAGDVSFSVGCLCVRRSVTTWADPTLPGGGQALYYLARAAEPSAGSFGATSEAGERAGACFDVCGP